MSEQDTICAVSTPAGEGGIGIIRISGRDALKVAAKVVRTPRPPAVGEMPSHTIQYGTAVDDGTGEVIDEVLVSVMRAPRSYTREDVVEINCHGGMAPLWRTLRLLLREGARQAGPGEFTKRAFLNGRIDLTQAEAVMDIIHARTELSLRAANEQLRGGLSGRITEVRERLVGLLAGVEAGLDFPDEEIEVPSGRPLEEELGRTQERVAELLQSYACGRIMRDGVAATIVGRPNVGKSSLMNALLQQDRAIVTEIPGTTRDVIEERLNIEGVMVRIIDTAGIRDTHDMVEQEGVRRSLAALAGADIVIVVLDGSEPLHEGDRRIMRDVEGRNAVFVLNKADLPRRIGDIGDGRTTVAVSCADGRGMDELRSAIAGLVRQGVTLPHEHAWVVNERHRNELELARGALEKAAAAAREQRSPELITLDLRDALDHLGMIVGTVYTDDILERIFSDFCIGK